MWFSALSLILMASFSPCLMVEYKVRVASTCSESVVPLEVTSDGNTYKIDWNGGPNGCSKGDSGLGRTPQIGKPAPDFAGTAVVNGAFQEIKLSDYSGKYVVLFFYPLDFTFVCPTEIIAFSERAHEFAKINTQIIAASTDSHYSHLAWINLPRKQGGLGKLDIPILADKNTKISRTYGVYREEDGVTLRGLYIIDDKGILRQITINDLPVGRSVDETLRLVQAFQFADKNGEVCPANWKPGKDTLVPDPIGSQSFFSKQAA